MHQPWRCPICARWIFPGVKWLAVTWRSCWMLCSHQSSASSVFAAASSPLMTCNIWKHCEQNSKVNRHKVISYQWVLFLCAAAVCRRGCLSSLRALDLSYNSLVGDNGWCSLFAAGGLGSLEDVDVSLRPSTSAPCSAWLPALLRALPQISALARLAMQRWTADCQEREQLRYCLKKRSVLLERDPDLQDTSSACKGNSQESLEESQPEE
ncbi:uncharacterized protein LOC113028759 isoform X1 [Astatotilapia calliptera]|uniref:uncharacterized protein LOC113028759 isoform X1 n=1 Tax=Astatotilapia calliptera TaxID=8154 RepID=UPI000E40BDA9|nr:uncharacterized protein LOC113028759 isoform X1 [Astatotilapia calliptera]